MGRESAKLFAAEGAKVLVTGRNEERAKAVVDDIKAAIADMQAAGISMIDKVARNGAGAMKIAFVHPKSAGCLLELCQPAATYVD